MRWLILLTVCSIQHLFWKFLFSGLSWFRCGIIRLRMWRYSSKPEKRNWILLEKDSINPQANQDADHKRRQDGKGLPLRYKVNLFPPVLLNRDMEDQDKKGGLSYIFQRWREPRSSQVNLLRYSQREQNPQNGFQCVDREWFKDTCIKIAALLE